MRKILRSDWTLAILTGVAIVFLGLSLAVVHAQSYVNNGAASPSPGQGIVVNETPQTVTFAPATVCMVRNAGTGDVLGASLAVIHARALCCGAPSASPSPDVTLSNGAPIPPGAAKSLGISARTECVGYQQTYCGVALMVYPSPSPTPNARAFVECK